MRFIFAVVLAGLCALAYAEPTNDPKRQEEIYKLFKYINQHPEDETLTQIVASFKLEDHVNDYTKREYYDEFMHFYGHHDMLEYDAIFSVFNEHHLKQAIALFKLFYYAKDYDTFYKTAVWARHHVNHGMFLYAVSVAIVHRPDTYTMVLPPIYEIYPHYFFSSEVINQAHVYKMTHGKGIDGHVHSEHADEPYKYVIHANYSGRYLNLHPEQYMSYYMEDIGMNAFYYYYNIFYPYWMSGEEFHLKNDHRGELFFFIHHQLLSRYYLERLAQDMGEIPHFDWDVPFEVGYTPSLTYPNGLEFPTRPNFAKLHEYFYNYGQRWSFKSAYGYSHQMVEDYERRIHDAIDFGYAFTETGEKIDLYTPEGLNYLGNLIEGNADSPHHKFYGHIQVFARHLLGYAYQPLDYQHVAPSSLEHYETSMRDPAFYMLYKKIILYYHKYKMNMKPYTKQELHFDGVKVEKVEFDKLATYHDHFYADITNAIYVTPEEYNSKDIQVVVEQDRLNHKPFTYKIHVHSDKDTKASVKVFIGPKVDEYDREYFINENKFNFFQLDHFVHDLKNGDNVITRHNHEMFGFTKDYPSHTLHKTGEQVHENDFFGSVGFPLRFALPVGRPDGMEYQVYVIVYPHKPYEHHGNEQYKHFKVGTGNYRVDGYDLAYPFDRIIDHEVFYTAPNHHFTTVKIFHEDHHEQMVYHTAQH